MKLEILYCLILLGLVWDHFRVAQTSSVRSSNNNHQRAGRDRACDKRLGIPKILHHIYLEGEAAYWRNATLGDEFTPNFYPKTKEKGDQNATFKHEWKTGCQRLMPNWRVHHSLGKSPISNVYPVSVHTPVKLLPQTECDATQRDWLSML